MFVFRSAGFAQCDEYSSRFVTERGSGPTSLHNCTAKLFLGSNLEPTGALRCVATRPTIEKFRVARSIS